MTVPVQSGQPSIVLSATNGAGYSLNLKLDASKLGKNVVSSSDTAYLWYRMNINFDTKSDSRMTWIFLEQTSSPAYFDTVSPPSGVVPKVDYFVYVISVSQNTTYTLSNVYQYRPINMVSLIVGLIFGLLLLIALIILALYLIRRCGLPRPPTIVRRIIRRKKPTPTVPIVASDSTPTPTPSAPESGSLPPTKRHVVNIDYLMTGARRVVVKDGNPTAMKVDDEATSSAPLADDEEEVVIEETIDGNDDPCGWFTGLFRKEAEL